METFELLSDRIEKYLNELIDNGDLKAGDRLPSERKLAQLFKSSNMPVRQALEKLVTKGLVRKEHGRGNFLKEVSDVKVKTNRIAFMYCHPQNSIFGNPFAGGIISGVDSEAHFRNKSMLLQGLLTKDKRDPVEIFHETMDQVDGVILFSLFDQVYNRIEKTIRAARKPVVVVNYEAVGSGLDAVLFDTANNVRQVVTFLKEQGHTRIGCVCFQGFQKKITHNNYNIYKRVEEFKAATTAEGLDVRPDLIIEDYQLGDQAPVKQVMEGPDPPTALFCTNDQLADSVIGILDGLGHRIPEDLTVVGYDGIQLRTARVSDLTTLALPLEQLGREAVRRLLEKQREMDTGTLRNLKIQLPGRMVKGKTHKTLTIDN